MLICDIPNTLRHFDPEQRYWHDATIVLEAADTPTIVTYWRNPELAGTWEFRYALAPVCFGNLLLEGLIERTGSEEPPTYRLTALGRNRL